jgi:hypothetical protein
MLAGNCFRGIGSDTSEMERTWKAPLKVLCWGNRLRWRNILRRVEPLRKRCTRLAAYLWKLQENMAAEARIREEIQRKFRAHLAETDSETCDECHKPFRLRDVTVQSKFIRRQCQVSQVDRRADAVFHYPQNIAIPNCPLLRTNDCE